MPSLFPAVAAALMVAAPAGAQYQPAAELPAPAAATATSTADQIDLARQWNAERAFRESWHRAGDDLRARISSGEADPEQEASRAAALARWSLITSYTSIPSGSVYAIGMECRPNRLLFVQGRLFFLAPHLSHTIADRETLQQDLERERRDYDRFRRFALVYNRALIRHLEFPFRDLCRPAADDARPPDFEQFAPDMPGFRDLKETDRPVDLYEAARRGSIASLRRMIAAQPRRLHIPDVIDMTPLAWAVAYDRPQHARLLLEAGSHPYGGPWQNQASERSPITIALEQRNRTLVSLMRPVLTRLGMRVPATPPLLDERRSRLDRLVRNQTPYGRTLAYLAGTRLNISAEGRVIDCAFTMGTHTPNVSLCDLIGQLLRFFPAEDGDGRAIAGSTYLRHFAPEQTDPR